MATFDIVKGLKRVRRVVNNGWCKGAEARSAKGVAVPWRSSTAKSYDLESACEKAAYGKSEDAVALREVLHAQLRASTAFYVLTEFNDDVDTKRVDVLNLINGTLTAATPSVA